MEEPAVRGGDERLAVERPGRREDVEEEVDGVDVDEVGPVEVAQEARSQRVARRTAERDPDDGDPVDGVAGREGDLGRAIQPVQRQNTGRDAPPSLLPTEPAHDVLEAAPVRPELPHDVEHAGSARRRGRRAGRDGMRDRHGAPRRLQGGAAFARRARRASCGGPPAASG